MSLQQQYISEAPVILIGPTGGDVIQGGSVMLTCVVSTGTIITWTSHNVVCRGLVLNDLGGGGLVYSFLTLLRNSKIFNIPKQIGDVCLFYTD